MIDRKVEVEIVQIAPLALQNYVCYDHMGIRIDEDFEGGAEHTIVLDMGADNTTLLVTNGEKIWIRNVPIGGNHFTRALTKEMKLTFALTHGLAPPIVVGGHLDDQHVISIGHDPVDDTMLQVQA